MGATASRAPKITHWKIKCDAVTRPLTAAPARSNRILLTSTMATEHAVLNAMRRRLPSRMAAGEDEGRGWWMAVFGCQLRINKWNRKMPCLNSTTKHAGMERGCEAAAAMNDECPFQAIFNLVKF